MESKQFIENEYPWPEGVKVASVFSGIGKYGEPYRTEMALDPKRVNPQWFKDNPDVVHYFYLEVRGVAVPIKEGDYVVTLIEGVQYPLNPEEMGKWKDGVV